MRASSMPGLDIIAGMPRRKKAFDGLSMTDAELMAAALIGLERQRAEIGEKMAELRQRLMAVPSVRSTVQMLWTPRGGQKTDAQCGGAEADFGCATETVGGIE